MIKHLTSSLLLTLLCTVILTAQDLSQTVSIKAENLTLNEVLDQISTDYQVSFSYLNNKLPDNSVDVELEGISLDHALTNLLEGFDLQHMTHSGQIIIKKRPLVEFDDVQLDQEEEIVSPQENPLINQEQLEEISEAMPDPDTVRSEGIPDHMTLEAADSVISKDTTSTMSQPRFEEPATVITAIDSFPRSSAILVTLSNLKDTTSYSDTTEISEVKQRRIAHIGLFYPLSSNGYQAGKYINNLSVHIFSGFSGGMNGLELSGVANIVRGTATGFQLAGVVNLVQEQFTGAQFAGITNITRYDFKGFQAAGIANVSYDRNLGLQMSGVANVARGRESGFQLAGCVNVTHGKSRFGQIAGVVNSAWEVHGIQAAGIVNVSAKQYGVQISPFLNKAGVIYGGQISGFINRAEEVKGVQIAPFLNVAKKVDGAQIGIINISDEMNGTPIGLFCLAKRNGYFDLELFYSDDFQANAAIKVGAPHFHNIFAFSYETDDKNRWAFGYGFGSQWGKGGVRLNTDLLTYYVVEQEFPNGAFRDFEVNLLSRFRLLPSLHVGSFGIFAGPTVNFMISDHYDQESGVYGSDITPSPLYEHVDNSGRSYKFWIGYNLGVRF